MAKKARILVVDDELKNVKLLEAHLLLQGYEVLAAGSGEEALATVAREAIDLLLLDVMMPGMDGFEVTRRLRAAEATRLLPIVLITALRETDDRVAGIEAGCDDFLSKPFEKPELLARVKGLLRLGYYRSLLDEKEKFERLMDRISDGIVVLDGEGRLSRLNERAAALLGLGPQAVGTDVLDHLRRRFTIRCDGDLRSALRQGAFAFDLERPETDTTKPLLLAARSSAVTDPAGAVSSIVFSVRDVTDERRERVMKQDFFSLISHKLRTPAAVILSNASLLQDDIVGSLTPPQRELVGGIVEKSQRLETLVGNLLAFTEIQRASLRLAPQAIMLPSYLPGLLRSLAARFAGKPIEWRVECPDPHTATHVQRVYFDLIVQNLVENAVKFNDKAVVQLLVAASRGADHVAVSIADNGPGIPPEEQEKIFETFYQVEKYFTGNVDGAGLGLPLVKRLVTAYGGAVRLRSELGRGATFTVTLPP